MTDQLIDIDENITVDGTAREPDEYQRINEVCSKWEVLFCSQMRNSDMRPTFFSPRNTKFGKRILRSSMTPSCHTLWIGRVLPASGYPIWKGEESSFLELQ
jgi:hypothetical protein